MFRDASSSSSEDEAQPFNAIQAAAEATRKIGPANPEDPLYKAITESLNTPQALKPPAPKRESRYIGKLVQTAATRKEHGARVTEQRLVAQQREDDAMYAGKERFVTSAYRKKLEDDRIGQRRQEQERRLEEDRASKGLGAFYASLFSGENVAMGGNVENPGKGVTSETRDKPKPSPPRAPRQDGSTKTEVSAARKRRRTRFGVAPADSTQATAQRTPDKLDTPQPKPVPKKRGLRRNDAASIEEYRRRYFQRRARRLGMKAGG